MQKVFMMRTGGLGSASVDHPSEKRRCSGKKQRNYNDKKSCHCGTTFSKKNNKNNTGFLGAETAKRWKSFSPANKGLG